MSAKIPTIADYLTAVAYFTDDNVPIGTIINEVMTANVGYISDRAENMAAFIEHDSLKNLAEKIASELASETLQHLQSNNPEEAADPIATITTVLLRGLVAVNDLAKYQEFDADNFIKEIESELE